MDQTAQIHNAGSPATVSYSCVQGWTGGGTGNISADPLLVDPTGSNPDVDFRTKDISPCIDAASNSLVPADDADVDGDDVVYDDDYTDTQTPVTYDKNGNLTADGSYKYAYDAWNRLVKVETQGEASSDVVTIGQYQYDALGRRIKKVVTNSGTLDGTQYAYYNNRWQLLETRNGSEIVESQTVFGTQYVDEIVRWWRDGRGAMYVFQDVNWNVTATVSHMTQPLDRIRTTPYGQPTFDVEVVNGDWDDDGDTDSADGSALLDCFSTGDEGDCRIYDYDDNGTINLNDYFDLLALMPAGTSLQRQPSRRTSPNHFPYAHQGLVLDEETGTYQNRLRYFHSQIRRFSQRDPIDVAHGSGLYHYVASNPISFLDPSGGRKIRVAVNAFIPGAWVPGPFGAGWEAGGDNRGFGQPGTSRLSLGADIESMGIGQGTIAIRSWHASPGLSTKRDFGDENPDNWESEISRLTDKRIVVFDWPRTPCKLKFCIEASAEFPFIWGWASPAIDITACWKFEVIGPSMVRVDVWGRHDEYPNYEGLIDNYLAYKYASSYGGPGLIGLNLTEGFATGLIVFAETPFCCGR